MKAVICGTGIDRVLGECRECSIETRFGKVQYLMKDDTVIIPRHMRNHSIAPGLINYKANVMALKELGCEACIGLYAVGSITSRLTPGSVGVIEDFLDFSARKLTFFDGISAPLRHTGMVNPFDRKLIVEFAKSWYKAGEKEIKSGIVYVMTEGPRLETPAEIRAFRNLGADVVGMTLASEAVLLSELEIPFAAAAYSINWAAGLDEEGVSFLEDETVERISQKLLKVSLDALKS